MSFPFTKFICSIFVADRFVSSGSTPSVLSDIIIPLTNNNWTLWSSDQIFMNLTAQVPGDLLSDLMMNGLIDDPYIDRNFVTQEEVWIGNDLKLSDNNFTAVGDGRGRDGDNDENTKEKYIQRKRTWIYSTT